MLALMKSKRKGSAPNEGNGQHDKKKPAISLPSDLSAAFSSSYPSTSSIPDDPESSAKALCALGGDNAQVTMEDHDDIMASSTLGSGKAQKSNNGAFKQQHQLPMFLSSE